MTTTSIIKEDLVTADEIAKIRKVTRPAIYWHTRRKGFPDPILCHGRVSWWSKREVNLYFKDRVAS